MKRILFIGRFQPFHKGHLSIIERTLPRCDELIIGIGSSENAHEDINPFTYFERYEMIEQVLKKENIDMKRVHIVPIPDIGDDKKWVAHVQNLTPHFDEVVTGKNEGYLYIKRLFEEAKIPVTVLENLVDIEASVVREHIKSGRPWKEFLHPVTVEYLKKIGGIERVKNIRKTGRKKS
jgi:nicotinamide-nucleotide adenylyltransferase